MTLSYENVTFTDVKSVNNYFHKKNHQIQQAEHNQPKQLASQKVIWEFTSDSTPRKPPSCTHGSQSTSSQTLDILTHCTLLPAL